MATANKGAKSKKTVAKKKAVKEPAVKKAVAKKPAVKKAVAKKPTAKKKVAKPVVKKKATKVKKKAVAKSSPAASVTKELRASIAALKQEMRDQKNEFMAAAKRENVLARLEDQRDAAIAKFLDSWDKKAMAALEKSLKPRSKKKSRKK